MIVFVYDRLGNQYNTISDFVEFVHDDELGKFDFIEFTTPGKQLNKGDYLVWVDKFGEMHENIVSKCTLIHKDNKVYQTVYAANSVTELNQYFYYSGAWYVTNTSGHALENLLKDTRWELKEADTFFKNSFYLQNETVYEALCDITYLFGGEYITSIEFNGYYNQIKRYISHVSNRGKDTGILFSYGFDTDEVERIEDVDEVYTRIYCFGERTDKTQRSAYARYGKRLTLESVNGGLKYLEDNEAMRKYGIVGKDGILRHSEGVFYWDDVDDASDLLELGRRKLSQVSTPRVSYTATIAVLEGLGISSRNIKTGDTVYIEDDIIDERFSGRVAHIRRYYENESKTEITIGNTIRSISKV